MFIYSYCLAAWAVLSIAHVIPLPPPTASLAVACTFNVFAAFLLPWLGVHVGIGTAAYSLRTLVVGTEAALLTGSILLHSHNVFAPEAILPQLGLLLAYLLVARYFNVSPVHLYFTYIPRLLAGVDIKRFFAGEYAITPSPLYLHA